MSLFLKVLSTHHKQILCFLFYSFITFQLHAQIKNETIAGKYPFIHTILNRISHEGNLYNVYEKLYALKTTGKGKVTIVHIGDSHVQAGYFTGVIRTGLQKIFGNAGRGLIFPYQLANSNAPADVKTFSNVIWKNNKIIHPEISLIPGISGFVIQTNTLAPVINFSINDTGNTTFNKLLFFFDSSNTASWVVHNEGSNLSSVINARDSLAMIKLDNYSSSFTIAGLPSSGPKKFYGVSLERDSTGVLYHTIGVNGASYDSYNTSPLFWQQLPSLQADVFIVSLGTNEAQFGNFSDVGFINNVNLFIRNLKIASPDAVIIITSPADSYKDGKPNTTLRSISNDMYRYCNDNNISFWNMYNITNGSGSVMQWRKYGLLQADGIHYTADGYSLQGSLLYNAFMNGYNDFEATKKVIKTVDK